MLTLVSIEHTHRHCQSTYIEINPDMIKSIHHYIELRKREIFTFSLLAAFWCAATWFFSERFANNRMHEFIDRERIHAKEDVENIASNIGQRILQVRSIPTILATDYYVVSALMKFGATVEIFPQQTAEKQRHWLSNPELGVLSSRLNELCAEISLHTLFILNVTGDCIAAGKSQEFPVFIGINYSDRKYFLEAQEGNSGRQFAVGRTDNVRALFYSKPVLDSGKFIGAIVSRINVENLANLVFDEDVFVTDENGVVILAKDSSLLMKALPGSKCLELNADIADRVYKKNNFESLELGPSKVDGINDVVRWKSAEYPYIHTSMTVMNEQIKVHVLRDLKQVLTIKSDMMVWFGVVSFTGTLLLALYFGILSYIRSISRHRQELIVLNENLDLLARTDALTGCANRRSYYEALETERQRGIRYKFSFSVLSLDIDHFKHINDTFGHPAGDQVLCHIVSIVGSIIRPTDKLGRVGGEEFGILLVQTTASDAVAIAERIRSTIEDTCAMFDNMKIQFTVSIGVSQWSFTEAESLNILISRCDNALYEAKRRGRNQVVVI